VPFKAILRVLIYSAITVVVIFLCTQLSFTFYFDKKIKNDFREEVLNQSKGAYDLKIKNLSTNLFNQSIYISDFILQPDKSNHSNASKYFVTANEIHLVDFKLFPFLLRRDLIIARMELVNPSGNILRSSGGYEEPTKDSVKIFSIYSLLKKHIHSLSIIKIEVSNADFKVYDDYRDTLPSISSTDNELKISNLRINKSTDETRRLFIAEKVNLMINKFSYTTKDSLYSFLVKKLTASYTDSTLLLDSLKLVPNYSKLEFATEAGKQTDRMQISIARLDFTKMNVKLFFERNWFISKQLNIDNLNLSAYRDKNDADKPYRPKSVQQLLKTIPIYTAIDSINLKNGLIAYEEVAVGATKPGKISFNNVHATITGFTSDTMLFSKYNVLQINAACMFMNKGKLNAHYSFPLNTDEMVFDCSGKLTDMPMQAFNPMLETNANVSMKNGMIDSMIFSFHANEVASTGQMKLVYHNLKIELLNKKNKKAGAIEDILTYLAHRLVIKEENPSPGEPVRVAEIKYPRDSTRFIFNYSWKSLLSGIKPSLGLPGKITNSK